MPYANIGDVKLFYQIYGSELEFKNDITVHKPTLIVLHGGPGVDHTYEISFLSKLSSFAQVIFLDHRGNGRSIDNNHKNWNLRRWGEDVFLFCETLGLNKPFIIGDSFGGHVAMQYGILYPDHAAGIILSDTEGEFIIEDLLKAYEAVGGTEIKELVRKYCNNPSSPENAQLYFQKCFPLCVTSKIPEDLFKYCISKPSVTEFYQQELHTLNLLPYLKKINTSILYLVSKKNPVHRFSSAKKTANHFSSSVEFKEFNDSGIISIDAKAEALACIKDFITKIYSKGVNL